MKIAVLVTAGFFLFLSTSSSMAEGARTASAAMTVYTYIIEVEAVTAECGDIDPKNAESYALVAEKFHKETSDTVMRIGFLIGQEARRSGLEKSSLLASVDALIDNALQRGEQLAKLDPDNFIHLCRDLPKAAAAQAVPFEPLVARFPKEMQVISAVWRERDGH